jgi:Prokaryotic RING finger family 1
LLHPILFIALIYYIVKKILRRSRHGYRDYLRGYEFLTDLAVRHGGNVKETGYRHLTYYPANGNAVVEFDCSTWPRMMIRLSRQIPFSLSLYRLPRLMYAFAEAFISPALRMDGLPYFAVGNNAEAVREFKSKQGAMSVLSELSTQGFSARFTNNELLLRKRFRRRDLNGQTFLRAIALADDLAQICSKPAIQIPIHTIESENRCAYCKEMIHEEDSVIQCSVCKTPHHSDCFALNGKCAVFGCASQQPVVRQEVVAQ